MKPDELPENDTEVILFTKHPTVKVNARFRDGVFYVDHWALKEVSPDEVSIWWYAGGN